MSGGLCAPLPSGKKLKKRVDDLEAAVLAVAALEFGDTAGHPFHGNQYVVMGTSAAHEEMRNGGSERLHALGSEHAVLEVESKYAANELLRKHPDAVSYTNSLDAEHHVALGRVPRTGDAHAGVTRISEPFFTEGTRHAVAASAEEFGDSPGHEFHGNQWTGTDGRLEGHPMDKLVEKLGDGRDVNINGKNENHREIMRAALAQPIPALKENGGKNLALRVAAEMHAAGMPRNSGLNGGNLTGYTKSQGSTGFSISPRYQLNEDKSKVVETPGVHDVNVVVSGKAVGVPYDNGDPFNDDNAEPRDVQGVKDKISGVLRGMGMDVQDVRRTSYQQGGWDDDIGYSATVKSLGEEPPSKRY